MKQPLLVSHVVKDTPIRGVPETVLLVPELCKIIGITTSMQQNIELMKSIVPFTRVIPLVSLYKLIEFNRLLRAAEIDVRMKRKCLTFVVRCCVK
jgi:hypothetical protein